MGTQATLQRMRRQAEMRGGFLQVRQRHPGVLQQVEAHVIGQRFAGLETGQRRGALCLAKAQHRRAGSGKRAVVKLLGNAHFRSRCGEADATGK
ncbi:hypothetical protein D9M71_742310 [compost metagenome]